MGTHIGGRGFASFEPVGNGALTTAFGNASVPTGSAIGVMEQGSAPSAEAKEAATSVMGSMFASFVKVFENVASARMARCLAGKA